MAERNSLPWGDAFLVNTPSLDRTAQQLYVQQQQRQARQQQENHALDQMMQKEFANIRSVDTPEVVSSYNKYKQLKKDTYFNKDLQRNPLAYNEAQQKVNQAYAEMQKTINKSKEIKEMTKTLTTDRFKNPDAYADDFGEKAATLINTPISALSKRPDLTNWDMYKYSGSNTDFNKKVKEAYGQPRSIVGKEEPLDKQGIQFRTPVYQYGNTPGQVFEGLLNSLDHKTERDAAYKWKQLDPDVVSNIEKQYNAIPETKWEQMGLAGPEKIDLHAGGDAEKYMRVMAMQHAINTNPTLAKYQNRTSEQAKMDLQFARQKQMEAIRHANSRDLIDYKKKIDPNDSELNNTWIDNYIDKSIDEAKSSNQNLRNVYTPHTSTLAHEVKGDIFLSKSLMRGNNEPDKIYVTKDGKIWPIFYKYATDIDKNGNQIKGTSVVKKNEKGDPIVDEDLSQPMTRDQTKLALGYKGQTKKELGKTMSAGSSKAGVPAKVKIEKHPLVAGKPKTVKQGGFIYTYNPETGQYE